MRVLICGSREWADRSFLFGVLTGMYNWHDIGYMVLHTDPFTLIEGGCPSGADFHAREWFHAEGVHPGTTDDHDVCSVNHLSFPVDHSLDGPWPGAGPRRNMRMLKESAPDLVVAFKTDFNWKLDKGGTENMVKIAKAAGVKVRVIQ